MSSRVFSLESVEEEFRAVWVRQITKEKVDSIIARLHRPILQEQERQRQEQERQGQEQQAGAGRSCLLRGAPAPVFLDVVVQRKLQRMRAHSQRSDLTISLVADPAL